MKKKLASRRKELSMCSYVTDENVERDYERQLHNIVIFDVGGIGRYLGK